MDSSANLSISAINRILSKLEQVREHRLTCFGSEYHEFQLNPPLSEKEIQIFECQQSIRLPEDYRLFLQHVGNGGAGPYYGLLPLEQWDSAANSDSQDFLQRPSALRPDMPKGIPWEQALNCSYEELFQGTLALVHQGCAYYALLVVTGVYRSRVVYVDLDCCQTPYFVHHPDFLSWYERWLDELLWGYKDDGFGFGLPGHEEDMIAILHQQNIASDRRREALLTLSRMPTLHQETLAIVRSSLNDASPQVRRQAFGLLSGHGYGATSNDIKLCLQDADPNVRKAALIASSQLLESEWVLTVRTALQDESPDVVLQALWLLTGDSQSPFDLTNDIKALLQNEDPHVREMALTTLSYLRASDWVLFAHAALQDESRDVVVQALGLLAEAKQLQQSDIDPLLRSSDEVIRYEVLRAIALMEDDTTSFEVPEDLLSDPAPYIRIAAIRRIGQREQCEVSMLIAVLRQTTEPKMVERLLDALVEINDLAVLPVLIEMTQHRDAYIRYAVVQALGWLGESSAIPALEALLTDQTVPVVEDEDGFEESLESIAEAAHYALQQISSLDDNFETDT
jgi:HEAT repeat protein